MNLEQLLTEHREEILDQATNGLARAHMAHYDEAGMLEARERLSVVYDLSLRSIVDRDLKPIVSYAEQVAQERFAAGYDLEEIQTALNVLEEAAWKRVIAECPPSELAMALGLISTVHGAGKDALARCYVSLATQTKATSLNLQALFTGAEGLPQLA
jgi:hypothetical protein